MKRISIILLALNLAIPLFAQNAKPGLYVENGILKKAGSPYRGIGVNSFDIFYRLLKDHNDTSYATSLQKLSDAGVPFVRFMCGGFWPVEMQLYVTNKPVYFSLMDKVVSAAEEKNIGLIPSFFWYYACVPDLVGEPLDQYGNSNSATIAFIKQYAEDVVTRYKDSPAIWGWELGNEYSLHVDLPNAADHRPWIAPSLGTPTNRTERDDLSSEMILVVYEEFAKKVREIDINRIILAANSMPRPNAWHNTHETNWLKDSVAQFSEILARDNPDPYDVYNVHSYPNTNNFYSGMATNIDGEIKVAQEFALSAKKPLFVGEFGVSKKYPLDHLETFNEFINAIEKYKVPLSAIWVYDFDDQSNDWNITFENDRSYMLDIITNLQAKFEKDNSGIIFEDNFNISSGSGNVNFQFDTSGRQTGWAAPLEYNLLLQSGDSVSVTDSGLFAGQCKFDATTFGGSSFCPDHNFLESSEFNVEFELSRTTNNDNWTGIGIGKNSIAEAPPWGASGFNFMCYPNGDYNIYDGGSWTANYNFAELSAASNNLLKIRICVSQVDFSGTNDAQISLFINNKPYPAGLNKFIYTKKNGFTNNFIGFTSYALTAIDNFRITTPQGNNFATTNWTSDADSEIASFKIYTHAVCFGNYSDVTINGKTFTGTGTNMSGNNWELKTDSGIPYPANDIFGWGANPNLTPESLWLVSNVLYNGANSAALTLSGLAPNAEYLLTLYSYGFENAGERVSYFSTSAGSPISLIDQDEFGQFNCSRLTYKYTAPDNGTFSVSTTATNSNNRHWGWFAFSNESTIPEPVLFINCYLLFIIYYFRKIKL